MFSLDFMLEAYRDKTVVVLGHTGFKGSWLSIWLSLIGAKVIGISLAPPSHPCHFCASGLADQIIDLRIDLRNYRELVDAIQSAQPDVIFHLAAQALVHRAYDSPTETFAVNVLGSVHVLEALRGLNKTCNAVIITSDKCYENVEWVWGYRETDRLGGKDPYSASKAAAELAIQSYIRSYFSDPNGPVRIAIARAGNVIGGGDWADNRIVPDCVRAWSVGNAVTLRNPEATRPWQHVLEPLSGYLSLAAQLTTDSSIHGEAFNFGPPSQQNKTVLELVKQMSYYWKRVNWSIEEASNHGFSEAGLLRLNCEKAQHYLGWQAVLDFTETIKLTSEWYRHNYERAAPSPNAVMAFTKRQIEYYIARAIEQRLPWALSYKSQES